MMGALEIVVVMLCYRLCYRIMEWSVHVARPTPFLHAVNTSDGEIMSAYEENLISL